MHRTGWGRIIEGCEPFQFDIPRGERKLPNVQIDTVADKNEVTVTADER